LRDDIEDAHGALIYRIAALDLNADYVRSIRRVHYKRPILLEECEPVWQLVIVRICLLAPPHKVAIAIHEICRPYIADSRELISGRLLLEYVNH
jgi:hypothetical protein